MKRIITTAMLLAAMTLAAMPGATAGSQAEAGAGPTDRESARLAVSASHPRFGNAEWAGVVREINEDGTETPGTETIGWSRLVRSEDGLSATVFVRGLKPGGVYTFWWVVPHADDPTVPDDVFVARGAGSIVGRAGIAIIGMRARTGQAGIEGFPPVEGAPWHTLTDPLNSTVRVEIAYHGQAKDADGDLRTWLSDFWTGTACPEPGETNQAGQPHCPVYFAATHEAR